MLDGKPEWVRCLLLLFLKYFTKHTPAHAKKQAQEVKNREKLENWNPERGLASL